MRPNKPKTTGEGDLFRARLDQIINMKHELVQLAARIDWDWIDREVAPLYSENGRPGIATRFVIGLLARNRRDLEPNRPAQERERERWRRTVIRDAIVALGAALIIVGVGELIAGFVRVAAAP